MVAGRASEFLALHVPGRPLLMPNPWDVGSARLLASLGFQALATTSSGFAATLGRLDHRVSRDEALAHGGALAAAVEVPVSADLENGFADSPEGVAATVAGALAAGLAGCSIEDDTGRADDPIYPVDVAVERVRAAAAAAGSDLVLTARCENHLHGRDDLDDTIARLQAYSEAGASVLFAPGVVSLPQVERLVAAVDRPVNVLVPPGGPKVAELASVGVARISVGGSLAYVALEAAATAARHLLESGSSDGLAAAGEGRRLAARAFGG